MGRGGGGGYIKTGGFSKKKNIQKKRKGFEF